MTTAIIERPIIFTPKLVREIIEGNKTQTRRVVKPQPSKRDIHRNRIAVAHTSPYGDAGDRLWVRETFWPAYRRTKTNNGCVYREQYIEPTDLDPSLYHQKTWTPSIHMFRWQSRINLEVVSVRVERLREISPEDALAEGIHMRGGSRIAPFNAVNDFRKLWDSINDNPPKRPYGWKANPFVWVVEFKKL